MHTLLTGGAIIFIIKNSLIAKRLIPTIKQIELIVEFSGVNSGVNYDQ